jgi:activating signal cointegrator complex subunit 3
LSKNGDNEQGKEIYFLQLNRIYKRAECVNKSLFLQPCYAAIQDHSPNKPVIIFVASRRQTRLTALDMINYAAGDANPTAFLGCSDEYIHSVATNLNDASLRHTITFGIGLHHAGLTIKDRDM